MNLEKLKGLEEEFLKKYPDGFDDDTMKKIKKKHNLQKHVDYIHEVCSEENLKKGVEVYASVVKVITRSSMVSVFEKMRFRDASSDFSKVEKMEFLDAVNELIHGREKKGFNMMLSILSRYNLAKWPIITAWKAYYYPKRDVFVKPTTVKKIIKYLELENVKYTPTPNYGFYRKYKKHINDIKKEVKTKSLKPNNPAFSGFLMMTIN